MLHIPPTNLLLLAAKQEPYKKAYLLTKNIGRIFWKRFKSMERQAEEKKKTKRVIGPRQKNKRAASKVESSHSPEIPDRGGETSAIPASFPGP